MKTIKCSFKSNGENITLTAILTDDLSELSKAKKNEATDICCLDDDEWSIYFDKTDEMGYAIGYEAVFKAKEGDKTLTPLRAITWQNDIIDDEQRLKVKISN